MHSSPFEEIEEEMERQYVERCDEVERDRALRLGLEQHVTEPEKSDETDVSESVRNPFAREPIRYGTPP